MDQNNMSYNTFSCGILFRGNYVTNRCHGSAGRMDPLPQVPKLDLSS
jgi:hypothetical protein